MEDSLSISDSLIGSLCREVESINYRIKDLLNSIKNSRNANLKIRLENELKTLHKRRAEVLNTAMLWFRNDKFDNFSLEFLIEISKRKINSENIYSK